MSDRRWSFLSALAVGALLSGFAVPAKAQTCAPTWSATQVYVGGNQASLNSVNYQANWWTQGQSPATNNGGPGSGQPWTIVGPCSGGGGGGCTVIPSVPGGLSSSNVTSSSAALAWNASTSGASCTVQYLVFQNGTQVASVSGTSAAISGLSASTTYNFTVAAQDQAGTSAQSGALSVTTASGGGGGGTCAPAWSATQVYVGGNQASLNGINYQANWWTQGQSPATNSGPTGSGQPWTSIGACSGGGGCTVIPSVPAGLSSSNVTSSSVTLGWAASTSGPSCTVQYNVFVNGVNTYQVSGTSVTASGLLASTTYNFTVSATDQAGTSAQSGQLSATTASGGGGGGGTARSAPYVDISLATGSQVATNAAAAGLPGITLAFLVDGGCVAVWGGGLGNVSNATFPNGTTVKSQIDALVAAGRKVIISWGGANGSALSSCGTASQAQAMYQSVFTAYPNITGQDFDIEGGVNATVLGQALAGLKAANPSKSISLTLPVLPTGLVAAGLSIVNACHSAGFHPDSVNVMAMDYGSANDNGGDMLLSAQQAAQSTFNQTGDMIGVTPMIGVNDTNTEIFTLANASSLVSWAKGQSFINRLAFWSLSRDNGGCAGQGFASATCSGLAQSTWQFSSIFSGF